MEKLIEVITNSNSNDIVKTISNTMHGKTFHHHYHILYDIRTLLGNQKKIYTEIGTFCGGSLSLMLNHIFPTEINCIDPLHVYNDQFDIVNMNIKKFNIHNYNVNIHRNFSNDPQFIQYLKSINFTTDILFIDGDHTYNGVINDFNIFSEFVNNGGFIVFDDYFDYKYSPEVRSAVDNIIKNIDINKYEVYGTIKNIKNSYDILGLENLNEFILYKKL
jgi:cephalosporin hydroxylase